MPDILLHIMLSIDDVSELARLASVCKIWNDVHSDDRLWSHLVELHYGHAIASQIAVQTCMRLEYCKLVCLHSNKLTGWCEDKFTSNASCYRMLLQRELTELHAAPNAMVTRGEIRWVSFNPAWHNTPNHAKPSPSCRGACAPVSIGKRIQLHMVFALRRETTPCCCCPADGATQTAPL